MEWLLISQIGIAGITDILYRKIPNWLILAIVLSGIIFRISHGGMTSLVSGLEGFASGIFLLYIPFSAGGVGGGDVKLLGALGAWLGPQMVFYVFLASGIIGGIFSLFVIFRHGRGQMINGLVHRSIHFFLTQKWVPEPVTGSQTRLGIPYAIPLIGGYFAVNYLLGGN